MRFNIRDIVLVPFPFINSPQSKQRPALVIGKCVTSHSYILAKITSTVRNSPDYSYVINNNDVTRPMISRCEVATEILFTIDENLIIRDISAMRVDAYERVREMILNNFPEA